MGFTKKTGVEEPIEKAKIVTADTADKAKKIAKESKNSFIDAVEKVEDEIGGATRRD